MPKVEGKGNDLENDFLSILRTLFRCVRLKQEDFGRDCTRRQEFNNKQRPDIECESISSQVSTMTNSSFKKAHTKNKTLHE